jgi:prepilin-type N-terminal cleavage/methylation domain-containing protein
MFLLERRTPKFMQKSKLVRKGRKGFTLVEVALAVAVGLIIIGGAIVAYNAVKQNASESNARDKVNGAVAMIESSAGLNNNTYPVSNATVGAGAVTKMWNSGRQDAGVSPWGGTNGASGVVEIAPFDFAGATSPGTDKTGSLGGTVAGNAGDLFYVSNAIVNTGKFAQFQDGSNGLALASVKNYMVSLVDKNGAPAWFVKGGN